MQKHCSEAKHIGRTYRFMIKARYDVPNAFNVPLFCGHVHVLHMPPGTFSFLQPALHRPSLRVNKVRCATRYPEGELQRVKW